MKRALIIAALVMVLPVNANAHMPKFGEVLTHACDVTSSRIQGPDAAHPSVLEVISQPRDVMTYLCGEMFSYQVDALIIDLGLCETAYASNFVPEADPVKRAEKIALNKRAYEACYENGRNQYRTGSFQSWGIWDRMRSFMVRPERIRTIPNDNIGV